MGYWHDQAGQWSFSSPSKNLTYERILTDIDWLYTLVQAGATFAAITGAFFTTKVLAIASEKRTLQNHVRELESEIAQRKLQIAELEEGAKQIEEEDASERIEALEDRFLGAIDVFNPPAADGMADLFEKVTGVAPNEYEVKALHDRYPQFLERVKEEAIQKADELDQQDQLKKLQEQAEQGNPIASVMLATALAQQAYRPAYLLKTGIPKLGQVKLQYEIEQENELFQKLSDEKRTSAVLEMRLAENRSSLRTLAFPRYVFEGFLSLFYLLVATVVIPLGIAPWWSVLPSYGELLIFLLFMSGLFVTIGYLYLEIRHAMGPTMQAGNAASQTPQRDELEEIKRMLVEHDVLSSLDGVLLLMLPLATFGISIAPQILGFGFPWEHLALFLILAAGVFLVSIFLLVRAKIGGSIAGRAQAWTIPLIYLGAFASSLVLILLTQAIRGEQIPTISLERGALLGFGGALLGNVLASYPTRWLARTLKSRIPWRSDEIESIFSKTRIVRGSYISVRKALAISVVGLILFALFALLGIWYQP